VTPEKHLKTAGFDGELMASCLMQNHNSVVTDNLKAATDPLSTRVGDFSWFSNGPSPF